MTSSSLKWTACSLAAGLVVCAATTACSGGEDCVADLDLACTPEYPATFDQIHERTLAPSCAVSGGACHAEDGAQGGLVLSERNAAYLALMSRIVPGDAACSELVVRLHATDARAMPPGAPLRDGVRCAIRTWVQAGAPK